MKNILGKLIEHASLSRDEARKVLLDIADGKCNDCQLAAFMTVYLMRGITLDELIGFRDAILERRLPVEFDRTDAIDIVGTWRRRKKYIQYIYRHMLCRGWYRTPCNQAWQLWRKLCQRRIQCA